MITGDCTHPERPTYPPDYPEDRKGAWIAPAYEGPCPDCGEWMVVCGVPQFWFPKYRDEDPH